ncbi:hypothetical protein HDU96_004481, partial [Phlyctochytrium bullatum]
NFSTPRFGHPSFPTKLLRNILHHVYPNDLITVAAVNRHLRRAVPQCIAFTLARHHTNPPTTTQMILNPSTTTITCCSSIRSPSLRFSASNIIWGRLKDWRPQPIVAARDETIRLNRVRALRESVVRHEWLTPVSDTPSDSELSELEDDVKKAAEMAGFMRSKELFEDLRGTFPDTIAYDFENAAFKLFLSGSAASGFVDGLELIPAEHPILREPDIADNGYGSRVSLLGLACQFGHAAAAELLLKKGRPHQSISDQY